MHTFKEQQPGIHIDTQSNRGKLRDNDERILRNLARIFFVSRIGFESAGRSQYPVFFMKPSTELMTRFNMSQEIACVLSDYETFDGRAFDVFDSLVANFGNRLDPAHVLVVARDTRVVFETARRNAQVNNRSTVAIPFTYEEMLGVTDNVKAAVYERLRKHLYTRDLFAYDAALQSDSDLFGRNVEIERLVGKFHNFENGCVFGLRRIGKTSVLFALQRRLSALGAASAYIDCQKQHFKSWQELLFLLCNTLAASIKGKRPPLCHIEEYKSSRVAEAFTKDLHSISKASGNRRCMIIFDEIEHITYGLSLSPHWATGNDYAFFWQILRSTFQDNASLLGYVLAGVNPHALETATVGGVDNPIYRNISPHYLPFFRGADVGEMVNSIAQHMGLEFEQEVIGSLTEEYGGHPYLVRQVCSRIHSDFERRAVVRPAKVTRFYYKGKAQEFERATRDYVELIVSVLKLRYSDEYRLLQYLAAGDTNTFSEFANSCPQMVEHLIGYGLIVEHDGAFHFQIETVKQLVANESAHIKPLPKSKEERWALVGQLRNSFEHWLKGFVCQTLQVRYGAEQGKEKILDVLTRSNQKDKLRKLEYREIFQSKKSELYLLDLERAVVKDWAVFENAFECNLTRFKATVALANKYRIDAHAKEIDAYDLVLVHEALAWLSGCQRAFDKV